MAEPNPAELHAKQKGCDEDERFYSSMVVAHDGITGARRYWKLKGKNPPKIFLQIGANNPETVYIILIPTPPADYVDSNILRDEGMSFPVYSYRYKVDILNALPSGRDLIPPASKENDGIVAFDTATPGWWPIRCTCTVLKDDLSECSVPNFGAGNQEEEEGPACDGSKKKCNKIKGCSWRNKKCQPALPTQECKKFSRRKTCRKKGCVWNKTKKTCKGKWD